MKKKILLWALAVSLMLSLAACGKSEAAKAVDDQIAAIGEVTLESEAAISEAEAAVDALSEEDRKQLDNTDQLEQARADYEALVLASKVSEVEDAIAAIGTVTLESADAISAARSLYDGSEADVQSAVSNLADLEAAETALSDLRVGETEDLIAAIGEVTLESADAVDAAQAALDALSDADAAKVSNADVLTAAAEQLKALRQAQVDSLLAGMRLEEDKVRGIRFYNPKGWVYYDSNTWAADQRCFILPYLGQDSTHTWLRLVLNYTGDDWVFFKQILMNIDGEQHQKSFSYFDVVRDNSGGRVWEYIDLDVSNDSDVEWLWDIANSAETIIRFQGDDYSHDMTVTDVDKAAIRDCLTVYEALN
ncbi:MAG TPA: hypothetical protein H9839_08505 [Candidatus Intestinimonas stercorigallinarum]|nr:hypothetical protein [Candidatus Intestinimonas stercorigallinarum]